MKKFLLLIACMAAMTVKATDRLPLKGGWNYVFYGKTEVQLTKQYAQVSFFDPSTAGKGSNDQSFDRNVYHKIKIYHEPVDRDINIITTGVIGGVTNKDKYPGTLKKDNATSTTLTLNELGTFDDNIITKIRLQINTNEVPCTVVINKVVLLDAEGNEALELYYNTENGDVFPYSGNVTWRNTTYQNMGNDTWKANIEDGQKAYYTFHFSEPTGAGFAIRNTDNAGNGGSGKDFVIPAGTTCYRYVAANPANNLMYLRRQAGVSNICIASITKTLSTEMQSVAINATGISSFVTDVPLDFTDKDVEVFVVESTSDVTYSSVTLKKVDKVAPGAYFVKGTSSTTVDNIAIYTEEIDAQSNILSGSTVFTGKATENTTRYALSNKDGMLHPVAEGVEIPAGKAYLEVPTVAGARALKLVFEDETTGIENVNAEAADANFFNLQGQRVNANTKGIIINNGRKIFNK